MIFPMQTYKANGNTIIIPTDELLVVLCQSVKANENNHGVISLLES